MVGRQPTHSAASAAGRHPRKSGGRGRGKGRGRGGGRGRGRGRGGAINDNSKNDIDVNNNNNNNNDRTTPLPTLAVTATSSINEFANQIYAINRAIGDIVPLQSSPSTHTNGSINDGQHNNEVVSYATKLVDLQTQIKVGLQCLETMNGALETLQSQARIAQGTLEQMQLNVNGWIEQQEKVVTETETTVVSTNHTHNTTIQPPINSVQNIQQDTKDTSTIVESQSGVEDDNAKARTTQPSIDIAQSSKEDNANEYSGITWEVQAAIDSNTTQSVEEDNIKAKDTTKWAQPPIELSSNAVTVNEYSGITRGNELLPMGMESNTNSSNDTTLAQIPQISITQSKDDNAKESNKGNQCTLDDVINARPQYLTGSTTSYLSFLRNELDIETVADLQECINSCMEEDFNMLTRGDDGSVLIKNGLEKAFFRYVLGTNAAVSGDVRLKSTERYPPDPPDNEEEKKNDVMKERMATEAAIAKQAEAKRLEQEKEAKRLAKEEKKKSKKEEREARAAAKAKQKAEERAAAEAEKERQLQAMRENMQEKYGGTDDTYQPTAISLPSSHSVQTTQTKSAISVSIGKSSSSGKSNTTSGKQDSKSTAITRPQQIRQPFVLKSRQLSKYIKSIPEKSEGVSLIFSLLQNGNTILARKLLQLECNARDRINDLEKAKRCKEDDKRLLAAIKDEESSFEESWPKRVATLQKNRSKLNQEITNM